MKRFWPPNLDPGGLASLFWYSCLGAGVFALFLTIYLVAYDRIAERDGGAEYHRFTASPKMVFYDHHCFVLKDLKTGREYLVLDNNCIVLMEKEEEAP